MSTEHGDDTVVSHVDGVVNGATAPVYIYVRYTESALDDVSFDLTSDNAGRLTLRSKQPAKLSPGNYTDQVVLDVCYDAGCQRPVTGSPKTITVRHAVALAAPSPAILLSTEAVAFSKTPFGSRLTQQIDVAQSGATQSTWTATTTAPWLRVTASGQPGQQLQITADPQGLSPGQYMTWVEVRASSPSTTRVSAVRVGLHVTQTASASVFANTLGDQRQVDPARPIVYSITNSQIAADHLYTGERLGTMSVPGHSLGDMAISRDGRRLLVADADRTRIWLFNTDDMTTMGSFALPPAQYQTGDIRRTPVILKVNGRNIMAVLGLNPDPVLGGYYMVDLDTGVGLSSLFQDASSDYERLQVLPDGYHYMVHTELSPNSLNWGRLAENSKGKVYIEERTSHWGLQASSGGYAYINRFDLIAGQGPADTLSCLGRATVSLGTVYINGDWVDQLSWQGARPIDTGCGGLEVYEGDQLFVINPSGTEFQVVARDGTFVRRWLKSSGISEYGTALKLSSDQLRVFDNQALQDLPR